MALIERVKAILLTPKTEWPVIDAEPGDIGSIYKNYLIYLAAIPAIAQFIGFSLVGMGGFGVSFRVPIMAGLASAVVSYLLSLAMIYVMSLIVNALAPTFGGQKNPLAAFKLMAYGSTAMMLAGIFSLIPALAILGLVGLYSIYLIYVGLPTLMKCPQDKALPYTAVLIVCGIVANLIIGALAGALAGGPSAMMAGSAGSMSIKTPSGEVSIDTRKLDEMARRMEEAGKKMEEARASADQAAQSGDAAASGQAAAQVLAALGGAASGTSGRAPIDAQTLKGMLPESLGGLKRHSYEAQQNEMMGFKASVAQAQFRDDARRIDLKITDIGGLAGLMMFAGWANVTGEKDTGTETEKIYKDGKRTVRERAAKDGSSATYALVLENGVIVEADGRQVDSAVLKRAVEGLDLAQLSRG
ncbi:MAG: Yip1 family protein [Burkholderiaceae bacterium]